MQGIKQVLSSIDMTEGTPWKKLLLFTVPLLIGNLFQQLYSTADAIILGRFVGDYALAAVTSTIPTFFLILVLLMGIAIGAGIMVSQYFGAKQREELSYTIGTSITLITVFSIILMVLFPFFTRPLLILLDTPPEILDDAVMYLNILIWGVLGMAYFNILSGILRGMGDSFSPLIYLAVACVLNVILNILLIVVLNTGVIGAAIGTVISQFVSSILCFRRLLQMKDTFDMSLYYMKPKKRFANQILKLGGPTGASHVIIVAAMMVIQPLVNGFGPLFVASYGIVMRIDGFVMMPIFSFGNAITVYAGQNMGAGKIERIPKGVKQCSILAAGITVVMVSFVLLFGQVIAGAFTQTREVVEMSVRLIRILAPGYIVFSVSMVLWSAVRGAGDAITPLLGSIINTIVIRIPLAYGLVHLMGAPEAIIYSLLIVWMFHLAIGVFIYRLGRWRNMGIVKHEPV